MRISVLCTALLCACVAPPPAGPPRPIEELQGRVAGAPQRCVPIEHNEALRIAGPNTLIYGRGRTLWVNQVPGCSTLRTWDILVLEPFGSQYCRGDIVRTRDSVSLIPGTSCTLGDFVPYRRS